MLEILENCQLEWDKSRGVLYVHNKETGAAVLRICGLRKDNYALLSQGMIDITHPEKVSYPNDFE